MIAQQIGIEGVDTKDNLYVITSNTKAYGFRMASASTLGSGTAYIVSSLYTGAIAGTSIGSDGVNFGFRPIVCLSPNVELVLQSNGNYNIENNIIN